MPLYQFPGMILMSASTRPSLGASAALLLLGGLAGAAPAAAQTGYAAPPVTIARVTRADVAVYANGVGTVQAFRSVLVRARVDGTLTNIAFREGQDVKPGDLLAEIDPRPYAALLAQARAKRAADAAQLQNARLDLARYTALARSSYASRQQADTQGALVTQDEANIQADDAAIESAALNLSFCRIESPINGVVGLRLVDIGNLIHATDTTGIVSITQVEPISLVFTLPEGQLPAVRAAMASGTPKVIAAASDGGPTLAEGTLLTPNNSIDTTTGTIELKATFTNHDRKLWPGQFVAPRVELGVLHDVIAVPQDAVQHGPDSLYVYTVEAQNIAVRHDIQVGYQGEGIAVVTAGLQAGADVITAGHVRVQAGAPVAPRRADAKS
jgi:multidrug efflux system membrane fusion protein